MDKPPDYESGILGSNPSWKAKNTWWSSSNGKTTVCGTANVGSIPALHTIKKG